jgi:hypothetical protein
MPERDDLAGWGVQGLLSADAAPLAVGFSGAFVRDFQGSLAGSTMTTRNGDSG